MGIKRFRNWRISYLNEQELDEMMHELYVKNYYQIAFNKKDPVIFDVGALIGETVLYFKDLYPQAKIVAFEPGPRSFALLKKNVSQNHLTDVRLVNAAVASTTGKMSFYTSKSETNPWGRGDSLKENRFNNPVNSKMVKVSTVKLSSYIRGRIDLLKLDIEGAETEVLKEIDPKLKYVRQIILEFHGSRFNPQNSFSVIMNILKRNGFSTRVFLSRWQIPKIAVDMVVSGLSIIKKDEYWLRIYAQHQIQSQTDQRSFS